jgi:hypothetical protein
MQELHSIWNMTSTDPLPDSHFGSLGLSDTDCLYVVRLAASVSTAWHIDRHEDAFNQTSLIISRCRADRLKLAFIVSRIGSSYFLDNVLYSECHQLGEYRTITGLLEQLRTWLARWSVVPAVELTEQFCKSPDWLPRSQVVPSGLFANKHDPTQQAVMPFPWQRTNEASRLGTTMPPMRHQCENASSSLFGVGRNGIRPAARHRARRRLVGHGLEILA